MRDGHVLSLVDFLQRQKVLRLVVATVASKTDVNVQHTSAQRSERTRVDGGSRRPGHLGAQSLSPKKELAK